MSSFEKFSLDFMKTIIFLPGLSDREQEQFLSTILHFLSRVHVLEDGKMAVSPQYAESWMEIEQAWHLGLRGKSGLNLFTLRAAKRGLTTLAIFHVQKHFLENI